MLRTCSYILILILVTGSLFATNWIKRRMELREMNPNEVVEITILHEKSIEGYQKEIEKKDNKIRRLEIRVARSFGMRFMIGLVIACIGLVAIIALIFIFKDSIKTILP